LKVFRNAISVESIKILEPNDYGSEDQQKMIVKAIEHRLLSPTYKVFQDIPNASDEAVSKHFLFWLALKTAKGVSSVADEAIYFTYGEGE